MTIERKRLLELTLPRLENEQARVNRELEEIQEELKGGKGRASRTAKKAPARRGRRTMTPAQRKDVSERMKKYWSQRKKAEKLAELYETQGRYAEAEPLYLQSLAILERAFRADHPNVAATLENLANLYRNTGREKAAVELEERAAAIRVVNR